MITMTVYHTDGREEVVETDLPPRPNLHQLKEVMAPYFPNAYTEHVNVLVGSRYTDMFVDEDGLTKRLPRNEKATAIYRNNWLTQHPNTDPEMMACIVGPAVVFSDRVWY